MQQISQDFAEYFLHRHVTVCSDLDEYKEGIWVESNSDELSNKDLLEKGELDELEDESFVAHDDSLPIDNILDLHHRIKTLQHQNELNIQQLHALKLEDERMRKELLDNERAIKKCQLENDELK